MVGNLIESDLSDVASLVDNGKLLKEKNCYAAIVSLLEKNKTKQNKTKKQNKTSWSTNARGDAKKEGS